MIAVHIMGGIGNQLFQYAFARAVALKNNVEFKLDITGCENWKNSHHNYYRLSDFNIVENFATADEVKQLKNINENDPNFSPDFLRNIDNAYFFGYWGKGDKYFSDVADIIRKEITPRVPFGRVAEFWKQKILSAECAVSLHIRHGDYLTPLIRNSSGLLPMDYYTSCIAQLKKDFPNLTVFVFSDDLKWAKNNFKLGVPTEFVEGCEKDVEELFLMSYCKHNITANSTFSWWGAWLNQNPDKKVFVPYDDERFKSGQESANSLFTPPLLPERFTAVPVDYSKKGHIDFPPTVSFILCVTGDIEKLKFTLESVLAQTLKNYELIVVNSSDEENGKICRALANFENVSIIRVSASTNKFAALNKGLQCARGEYVLFIDEDTFIVPQFMQTISQFSYNYLKYYTEKERRKYLSYEEYNEVYPNIICSAQHLEENVSGNLGISGVPDKRFSVVVDAPFKNLSGIAEVNLPLSDRCTMLANKSINNLLCTKLFKRVFLEKYSIFFKDSIDNQEKIQFHFLMDSFLCTENVAFVPYLWSGKI